MAILKLHEKVRVGDNDDWSFQTQIIFCKKNFLTAVLLFN